MGPPPWPSSLIGATASLKLHTLEAHPKARCTDRSTAGYYFAAGADNSSDWIVLLESGGWCWDAPSCEKRWETQHYRCTSSGWPTERRASGLLASTAPRLAHSHKVLVPWG